jgi:hypothetical protein
VIREKEEGERRKSRGERSEDRDQRAEISFSRLASLLL